MNQYYNVLSLLKYRHCDHNIHIKYTLTLTLLLILWNLNPTVYILGENWKIYLFCRIYLHPRSLQVKPAITKFGVNLTIRGKYLDTWSLSHQYEAQTSHWGEVEEGRIKWKLLLMTFAQTFKKFQHFLKIIRSALEDAF